jgi:hypothetical protein
MTWLCCFVLPALAWVPQQAGQPPVAATRTVDLPPKRSQSPLDPEDLPVSIERIQRALSIPPALRLSGDTPVFRLEVFGRKPTIKDFIGTDVFKGPVPRGSAAHQEFLQMVTPDDVRGYAAFSNTEGIAVAISSFTNAMLLSATQRAIRKYRAAARGRETEAARQEVAAALAALERARKDAGLPPK